MLASPFDADPPATWLADLVPGTRYVYEDVGVLWRTQRALLRAGAIMTPDGLRDLIEEVYGSDDTPPRLQRASDQAHGTRNALAAAGNFATLNVSEGYTGDARGWVNDARAPTRLGQEETMVRLARVTAAGAVTPWALGSVPPQKAWALSEIRLRSWRVPAGSMSLQHQESIEALRAKWARYEREIPVLPMMEESAGVWRGCLVKPDGDAVIFTYSTSEGMSFGPRSR